jgi:K+-transporting ATPase ATPase C chain
MNRHLTANLWLLLLTILICAGLYPLVLLGIGRTVFHEKANGSFILDKSGQPIGSRLIAQPFASDEYFQPRPSAVGYNAAATGGSNWGGNNPALRKRVVGTLGLLLKYRNGKPVGPDIVAWVRDNLNKDRTILAQWISADGNLAERWGLANAEFLKGWEKEHEAATAKWRNENPGVADIPLPVLAGLFFENYLSDPKVAWPETDGKDLQSAFFELWWHAHLDAEFEPVPADLVMTSGGGIDPHITLKAAIYQLDRVAGKWAETTKRDPAQVKNEIESLLRANATAPLGGLVGVDLINVLEVNVALRDRFGS